MAGKWRVIGRASQDARGGSGALPWKPVTYANKLFSAFDGGELEINRKFVWLASSKLSSLETQVDPVDL